MTEEELGLGPRNASIKVIILKPARLSLQSTARSGHYQVELRQSLGFSFSGVISLASYGEKPSSVSFT